MDYLDSLDNVEDSQNDNHSQAAQLFDDIGAIQHGKRNERLGQMLVNGEIQQVKGDDTFLYYSFKEEAIRWVKCRHCGQFLSTARGGHRSRHLKRTCLRDRGEPADLLPEILSYCATSGQSFLHLESDSFRQLLRGISRKLTGDEQQIKLPSRKQIKDALEDKYRQVEKEIGEKLRPHVVNKQASLLIDFGTHFEHYLSAFLVYTDTSEARPTLQVLPYCFCPTEAAKTAEVVRDMLVEKGRNFDLSEEQVLSLQVVSDGARNLEKMGAMYFDSWTKCGCHLLQKISERVVDPLKRLHYKFEGSELVDLDKCQSLLEKCGRLAHLVHDRKKLLQLEHLPAQFVVTRWQTAVKCAKDIRTILPNLATCSDSKISRLATELYGDFHIINNIITVLERFEPLLFLFEKSTPTIHLFLPKMSSLLHQLKVEEDNAADGTVLQILLKSARVVVEHYMDNDISDLHIMATLLFPRTKRMSKISDTYRERAIEKVTSEMEKLKEPTTTAAEERREFDELYDEPLPTSPKDELSAYFGESVDPKEDDCPLAYWDKRRVTWPKLSTVAIRTFSIFTSEAICERAFSAVKSVVTQDRNRLNPALVERIMMLYFYSNNTR